MIPRLLLVASLAGCNSGLALRWTPASEGPETWDDARRGVWWGLASLGAGPDASALSHEQDDSGATSFSVNPERLQLGDADALQAAYDELAAIQAPVEIGQLFLATVYEPDVYYAITATPPDFASWQVDHPMPDPFEHTVDASSVSFGARTVRFDTAATSLHSDSVESDGSHEVLDVLPNGLLRFAVYDADDRLAPEVDPLVAVAGGPGTCMSCHFGKLLRTFDQLPEDAELDALIADRQVAIDDLRSTLDGPVDFADDTAFQFEGLVMPFVNGFPP